jgi:hypothetical protein
MSDFVFEFGDGSSTSFPQFTVKEYEALQTRCAAVFKKQNRLLVAEQALTPLEAVRVLKEIDPKTIGPFEVEVFVSDDREARKVLLQSQAKSGVAPDAAEANVAKISVVERAMLAKHVVGLINLSPLPEESRQASARMKAIALTKGADNVENMTIGSFYDLMNELVPPPDDSTPQGWFEANTDPKSVKSIISAA